MSKYYDIENAINKLNDSVKSKSNFSFTSLTFCLLGVAFIVLQLCGVIHWPWIWVVAPFWIPLAIAIVILILLIIFLILAIIFSKKH